MSDGFGVASTTELEILNSKTRIANPGQWTGDIVFEDGRALKNLFVKDFSEEPACREDFLGGADTLFKKFQLVVASRYGQK